MIITGFDLVFLLNKSMIHKDDNKIVIKDLSFKIFNKKTNLNIFESSPQDCKMSYNKLVYIATRRVTTRD